MNKIPSHFKSGAIVVVTAFLVLLILTFSFRVFGLAGVSVGDYMIEKAIVANKEIIWTEEMEKKRINDLKALQALEKKKVENAKQTIEKHQQVVKEVKPSSSYNLDKLAYAVAMHETKNCTIGNSAHRNNCFGIMQWDKKGNRSFKRYETKEESYADFKRIWEKHYKGMPNYAKAKKYSGNDRPNIWLKNVNHFYYQ